MSDKDLTEMLECRLEKLSQLEPLKDEINMLSITSVSHDPKSNGKLTGVNIRQACSDFPFGKYEVEELVDGDSKKVTYFGKLPTPQEIITDFIKDKPCLHWELYNKCQIVNGGSLLIEGTFADYKKRFMDFLVGMRIEILSGKYAGKSAIFKAWSGTLVRLLVEDVGYIFIPIGVQFRLEFNDD